MFTEEGCNSERSTGTIKNHVLWHRKMVTLALHLTFGEQEITSHLLGLVSVLKAKEKSCSNTHRPVPGHTTPAAAWPQRKEHCTGIGFNPDACRWFHFRFKSQTEPDTALRPWVDFELAVLL